MDWFVDRRDAFDTDGRIAGGRAATGRLLKPLRAEYVERGDAGDGCHRDADARRVVSLVVQAGGEIGKVDGVASHARPQPCRAIRFSEDREACADLARAERPQDGGTGIGHPDRPCQRPWCQQLDQPEPEAEPRQSHGKLHF